MSALDAALHGLTTAAREDENCSIQEVSDNFLCALEKVYAPRKMRFSVLGDERIGAQCATWRAVGQALVSLGDCTYSKN